MGDVISFGNGGTVNVIKGKNSDGAKGNIKKASRYSFGRSICLEIGYVSGSYQMIKVNRCSVINFLNANLPKGVKPLKKGWRPFSKGASDIKIQARLFVHFNRWEELEAMGEAFRAKGKIKEAVLCYKSAAMHSNSAISALLTLLIDHPKDVHFTSANLAEWIEARVTPQNNEELAQLCETYKQVIEEMQRDHPTSVRINALNVKDLEVMAIQIRGKGRVQYSID